MLKLNLHENVDQFSYVCLLYRFVDLMGGRMKAVLLLFLVGSCLGCLWCVLLIMKYISYNLGKLFKLLRLAHICFLKGNVRHLYLETTVYFKPQVLQVVYVF